MIRSSSSLRALRIMSPRCSESWCGTNCSPDAARALLWKRCGMKTISKRTQYGLKAMLALGSRYGEGPILISTLAKEESIPLKFLEAILLDLKGHGLLASKSGKGGGYQLTRPPSTVTIGSLIRVLE